VAGSKVVGFSNSNSKKCYKCQGCWYIASNYPIHKIIVIIEKEIAIKDDLPKKLDYKDEVTYVHDKSED
jgi:hypothetical protein